MAYSLKEEHRELASNTNDSKRDAWIEPKSQ